MTPVRKGVNWIFVFSLVEDKPPSEGTVCDQTTNLLSTNPPRNLFGCSEELVIIQKQYSMCFFIFAGKMQKEISTLDPSCHSVDENEDEI